jgi:hypothetical protein
MKIALPSLVAFVITIAACHTTKYLPENFEKKQIHFGSGGGFTGITNTYQLLDNGQIFHKDSRNEKSMELPELKKKEVKNWFAELADMPKDSVPFIHPGNMSKFIYFIDNKDTLASYVWGDYKYKVSPAIDSLYHGLTDLVKSHSPKIDTTTYER